MSITCIKLKLQSEKRNREKNDIRSDVGKVKQKSSYQIHHFLIKIMLQWPKYWQEFGLNLSK